MNRERAIEKEKELLLRRHNKLAKTKLTKANIDIPDNILEILCSITQRSEKQKKQLESFRAQALDILFEESKQLHAQRLQKAKRTKEANMEKDPRYIRHMGIWVNTTLPSSKISRETYARINNRSTLYSLYEAKLMQSRGYAPHIYIDETNGAVRYTEKYCLWYQQQCLKNFDINMKRYQELDHQIFDIVLMKFVNSRKFQEIYSLEDPICTIYPWEDERNIVGFVYIMVLDEYNQAYIGITEQSVQSRILQHWKKNKSFDRLIWGSVENSVISIDSFGALDTTRLFVKPYYKELKTPLEIYEAKCIKTFDERYLLNRLK